MTKPVLKKSRDRTIAGVCGGIAEYLGWRPGQVRAIFVFLAFCGGAGFLTYLVLWLVMPPADSLPPEDFDLEDFRKQ